MAIVLLAHGDLSDLCEHLRRHISESGRGGDVIFSPRSAADPFDEAAAIERHGPGWARSIDEPHWGRTWGLVIDSVIRGHVGLHGGRITAESHRATLGMGIERDARGHGNGRALLDTAIAWARTRELAWLDLGVFEQNARARALYASAGFVELGTTRDRFRVEGQQIADVTMTLAL